MKIDHLGKQVEYPSHYTPSLLQGLPRHTLREALNLTEASLPFHGIDYWNAYEFSWLTPNGKPEVRFLTLQVPCDSTHIVESKSLKLYLGSFNMSPFQSEQEVLQRLEVDLSKVIGASVKVRLESLQAPSRPIVDDLQGVALDALDPKVTHFDYRPALLDAKVPDGSRTCVKERLYSHLFRSLCPVTGQPDWATLVIDYEGAPIRHENLLRYMLSFRNHAAFHEDCVERIFIDLITHSQPEWLTVAAYFTRRGGIEINPVRSNRADIDQHNVRMARQ